MPKYTLQSVTKTQFHILARSILHFISSNNGVTKFVEKCDFKPKRPYPIKN